MSNRATYKGLMIVLVMTLMGGVVWADGRSIAGSEKTQTLAFEGTRTLLSGLEGEQVCATIINRSEKTASIQLTLIDDGIGGSTMKSFAKGESAALCGRDTESVSVECLGPKTCAFTWSVDTF
ncbi:MAG: hypothetical protein JRG94_06415 [Deltaproteobacteria bacterium]|nr:hypothetical protein [Deltaproteobacteria bacterium]MBW2724571.1 hypothetical protein [Deltaproteobacteria bacterium]